MPLELSDSARSLLRLRYLRRDEEGRIIETAEELFWRVARAVAAAEDAFPRGPRSAEIAEKFYELMTTLRFLPTYSSTDQRGNAARATLRLFRHTGS